MGIRLFAVCLGLFALTALRSPCADTTYVRFNTSLGYIDVQLLSDEAPNTVANFLNNYVNIGAYTNSIIHRVATVNVDGVSVIQGGGFYNNTSPPSTTNAFPPAAIPTPHGNVTNEFNVSNTIGTIAMAKMGNDPNSANSQWYFNVTSNTALDTIDGGFTVFGVITNANGLAVMNQIAAVKTYSDGGVNGGGAFTELPLLNFSTTSNVLSQNYVTVYSITPLVTQDYPTWQTVKGATLQNDGVPLLLKYLCDVNPTGSISAADRAKLPTLGTTKIGTTNYITLTYHQYAALVGVTVNVQTSTDLKTWTTVANPIFVQTGLDSNNDPIFQIQVAASGTKQFLRLNITQP